VWEDVLKSEVPNHPELLESFGRIVEEGFKNLGKKVRATQRA
jgi:hypothetical protein